MGVCRGWGQSCGTEPLACGIWHYLQVDSVRTELNLQISCLCPKVSRWCSGRPPSTHWKLVSEPLCLHSSDKHLLNTHLVAAVYHGCPVLESLITLINIERRRRRMAQWKEPCPRSQTDVGGEWGNTGQFLTAQFLKTYLKEHLANTFSTLNCTEYGVAEQIWVSESQDLIASLIQAIQLARASVSTIIKTEFRTGSWEDPSGMTE